MPLLSSSSVAPRWPAILWFAAALLACLIVAIINRGPLYYFDTAGYLEHGQRTLSSLGISVEPQGAAQSGTAQNTEAETDNVVVGSRSALYSLLLTVLTVTTGPMGLVLVHSLALMSALWMIARAATRELPNAASVAATTALPVLAASLTALPFYTAYMMPDIFAAVLILIAAGLAAFGREMSLPERLFALGLGVVAVVVHPSHLLMAVLLIPVVALAALALKRQRFWLPPLLMTLIVLGGIAERMAFRQVVKTVKDAEVVYQPFLTARVIADGPGLAVLEENCPDETLATCALYEALQVSDDPWRLTASHILFQRSSELGSYRLLPAETQKAVADEQIRFFLKVLVERPFGLTLAFLRNTLEQANLYSVQYTVPTPENLEAVHKLTDLAPPVFDTIRLLGARESADRLTGLHGALYAAAALIVVVLIVLPQKGPPLPMRVLTLVILAGILINAFVCGGVSQPSDRYGARVAFLLPMAAAFILIFQAGASHARHK